jgi:murein DD-endopeptidase MepM/ murein hydrolase activator NlpD
MQGYGYSIVVYHGYGMKSLYAHLSKIYVRNGQWVEKNSFIGRTGNSGLVAGPHLHYEIRKNGLSIDPTPYLNRDILTAKTSW